MVYRDDNNKHHQRQSTLMQAGTRNGYYLPASEQDDLSRLVEQRRLSRQRDLENLKRLLPPAPHQHHGSHQQGQYHQHQGHQLQPNHNQQSQQGQQRSPMLADLRDLEKLRLASVSQLSRHRGRTSPASAGISEHHQSRRPQHRSPARSLINFGSNGFVEVQEEPPQAPARRRRGRSGPRVQTRSEVVIGNDTLSLQDDLNKSSRSGSRNEDDNPMSQLIEESEQQMRLLKDDERGRHLRRDSQDSDQGESINLYSVFTFVYMCWKQLHWVDRFYAIT
ncbi:hypothetical protein QAD02_017824 [Eretmocerus hayati]|uniref:Uncharacterized protein n=1 Tax=Eretmocerus hayati TaxID=131215 RepID=A0ACC2PHY6_9HYME|nr:hypothetical protein QAD02_017824 [Eretmocerus hayati]